MSQEAICTILHASITSHIEYCNSLINGLPVKSHQETPVCAKHSRQISFPSEQYDYMIPPLVMLYWLPVKYRIEFKTLFILFKGLNGKVPSYF